MKKIIVCVVLLILSSTISSCVAKSDREVNVEPINNEELKEQIKEELKQELLREEKEALIIPDKPSSEEIEERAVLRNKVQEVNSELKRIKEEELKAKRELELQKLEESQINSPLFPEQNSVVINTESSNLTLRSEASTNSKALSSIPKNTKVNYNKTKQIDNYTWYNVEYGGKEGWIRGDYVRPN